MYHEHPRTLRSCSACSTTMEQWECHQCTLYNGSHKRHCAACGLPRTSSSSLISNVRPPDDDATESMIEQKYTPKANMSVLACYMNGHGWYPGKILSVSKDDTVMIKYNDGDLETNVPLPRVCKQIVLQSCGNPERFLNFGKSPVPMLHRLRGMEAMAGSARLSKALIRGITIPRRHCKQNRNQSASATHS